MISIATGKFEWSDGTNFDYDKWTNGEPNDAGGVEDCAHQYPGGTWNDINCDASYRPLCGNLAEPTPEPSKQPSVDPTISPTVKPSNIPTPDPTLSPTSKPTASPSAEPSTTPTKTPSAEPTTSPTMNPSMDPTGLPSTPAPLHDGELECGQTYTGDYNDDDLIFEVRMAHDGDMIFDASGTEFEIESLEAFNVEAMDEDGDGILTLVNLEYGLDVFIQMTAKSGTYGAWTVVVTCTSD